VIETQQQLDAIGAGLLPGVLKTSRLGYDGKGQVRVASREQLAAAWDGLKRVPCVLERLLPLKAECSVILARGQDGQMVNLPVQLNVHRHGILALTEVHADNLPSAQARQAVDAAGAIAQGLDYVGVLCVEFFLLDDGSLVVNEIAPRPHNSGHYSIDACDVSQFELQVRTLAGLPLVQPRQHSPAIMLNLLGDLWFRDANPQAPPPWEQIMQLPGAHLHLYGKTSARPGRKMGHLTLTGPTRAAVRETAAQAARLLRIEPFEGG
jgi:5-(carboxyamino)imidazole ribonucleotide synthase